MIRMATGVGGDERVYNFSPGPAVLPVSVLKKAQEQLLSYPGCGASVLEISHRSDQFIAIMASAKSNLQRLLKISDDYEVLFLQGGSRLQFSMVPMNLLKHASAPADYITTGTWGKAAWAEAKKEGSVAVAWDGKADEYSRLPKPEELKLNPSAPYVYFTSNETIEGVQFSAEPEVGSVPLVCDASSDFLHRPLPVDRYGLIYACAQKNAGPAGVTIVIIRKDLLGRSDGSLPGYMNYKSHADKDSMFNTPPTFAIYLVDLVTQWLLDDVGGLEAMHKQNAEKSKRLYDTIDASDGFYRGHAQPTSRSLMNVTFRLPSDELQDRFISEAEGRSLCSLQGHRSVGGIRASIYNAMPVSGVEKLCDFMTEFHRQHA